jgi:hypothetical protein
VTGRRLADWARRHLPGLYRVEQRARQALTRRALRKELRHA